MVCADEVFSKLKCEINNTTNKKKEFFKNHKCDYLFVCDCPLAIIPLSESTVESGDHQRTTWRQQLVGYIQSSTNCDLHSQKRTFSTVC